MALTKKAQNAVVPSPTAIEEGSGMIELDRMDEADVRHERCPICKFNPLERVDGFKVCPRCETTFKVLDGTGYIIDYRAAQPKMGNPTEVGAGKGEMIRMDNRIINRMRKMAGTAVDMEKLKAIPLQELQSIVKDCYSVDLDDEDAVENFDPYDDKKLYEAMWERIQDNFDVNIDPNSRHYLPLTSDVELYLGDLGLEDIALGVSPDQIDDAKENNEKKHDQQKKEREYDWKSYEHNKI